MSVFTRAAQFATGAALSLHIAAAPVAAQTVPAPQPSGTVQKMLAQLQAAINDFGSCLGGKVSHGNGALIGPINTCLYKLPKGLEVVIQSSNLPDDSSTVFDTTRIIPLKQVPLDPINIDVGLATNANAPARITPNTTAYVTCVRETTRDAKTIKAAKDGVQSCGSYHDEANALALVEADKKGRPTVRILFGRHQNLTV